MAVRGVFGFRSTLQWSLRRTLASATSKATATTESVKAPIQLYGLEGRYAHALYSAASKQKSLNNVEEELNDFNKLVDESASFSEFIKNPTVRKRQKKVLLDDVLKAKKYSDLTANFFGVLADNNRLVRAPGVIKAFGTLMSAHRGEITCVVTTAKTLASKDIKDLEGVLNGFLEKGQKLNVNYQIDPSLIGGMIVDIGDKYIDMSTATKINKIIKSIEEGL